MAIDYSITSRSLMPTTSSIHHSLATSLTYAINIFLLILPPLYCHFPSLGKSWEI